MVARYVYLHIDVNKEQANFSAWDKLFPTGISGTPHVEIISSDGRVIHNKAGGVGIKDLEGFLSKSGKLLGEKALAQIQKALETAQKALEDEQPGKAVAAINPVLGTGGAGEVVQQAEALGKKLADDAKDKLKSSEEKLGDDEDGVKAALEILQVNRDFAKLKALKDDLKKSKAAQNHKDHRTLFEQAKLLDAAGLKVAAKKNKEAAAQYQQVVTKWPDSAAAKLATEKIAELGVEPAKSDSAAGPAAGKTEKGTKAASASTSKSKDAKAGGDKASDKKQSDTKSAKKPAKPKEADDTATE